MSTITLSCLVVGENSYENAFNVKVNKTEAVSELKDAIKEKIDDNVKAKDLKLWKISNVTQNFSIFLDRSEVSRVKKDKYNYLKKVIKYLNYSNEEDVCVCVLYKEGEEGSFKERVLYREGKLEGVYELYKKSIGI
ncbi:6375_t:CDS:2 [Rhizophagus irregularis]|nr:6375_t:CDS:2 [Rhizophagus irregularis]